MTRLEAQHLTCAYGRQTVLYDLSVLVQAGEIVALLGPNGAGKTTLLRHRTIAAVSPRGWPQIVRS